jgi:regulator of RNase E activity RraA
MWLAEKLVWKGLKQERACKEGWAGINIEGMIRNTREKKEGDKAKEI